MNEATASKRFAGERDCSNGAVSPFSVRENASTQRSGYSVSIFLNLVCLDAPIVAVSWQWLFARAFGIGVAPGASAALFLTAWFIYLADRFGDSLSVRRGASTSLRERFCLQHRSAWIVILALVAASDVFVIFAQLESRTQIAGAAIGAFALVYLIVNQVLPSLWRLLPLKELSIGFLFAAGTMVGLGRGLTSDVLPAWLLFVCVCSLNCITIAVWERDLDAAQERVSIATAFPKMGDHLLPALLLLSLTSLAFAVFASHGSAVHLCIAASAILLGVVHFFRHKIEPDTRTALADLVLLMSVIMLLL